MVDVVSMYVCMYVCIVGASLLSRTLFILLCVRYVLARSHYNIAGYRQCKECFNYCGPYFINSILFFPCPARAGFEFSAVSGGAWILVRPSSAFFPHTARNNNRCMLVA